MDAESLGVLGGLLVALIVVFALIDLAIVAAGWLARRRRRR